MYQSNIIKCTKEEAFRVLGTKECKYNKTMHLLFCYIGAYRKKFRFKSLHHIYGTKFEDPRFFQKQ